MNKKNIIFIIIVVILFVSVFFIIKNAISTNNSHKVIITQYKVGTNTKLKNINIDSTNDLNQLKKYIEKLKPLNDSEMVSLSLAQEINIEYNESISIGIDLGISEYCYYINKDKNISSLSKMPKGLYEWIEEKIEENKVITPDDENIDVDELINKLINSEEYSKMSYDKRKEACEKLLKELKEKGAIKNYLYTNSTMIYSFEYKDGSLGGIRLEDDWDPYLN